MSKRIHLKGLLLVLERKFPIKMSRVCTKRELIFQWQGQAWFSCNTRSCPAGINCSLFAFPTCLVLVSWQKAEAGRSPNYPKLPKAELLSQGLRARLKGVGESKWHKTQRTNFSGAENCYEQGCNLAHSQGAQQDKRIQRKVMTGLCPSLEVTPKCSNFAWKYVPL